MLPIAWWLLSESFSVLGLILLLRVMGNCVKQELRSASAHFLNFFLYFLYFQLNIGRRGTKWHWNFLAADLVCSQNIEHLRRGIIIIALHIWRLSSFLQIYQISWVSYFTSLVCDQEREGVKLSIWSTQGSPTACLNISKRVLTLKHVFSFSTKHAAAINGDLSVSFSFQSLSTRRWRFRSK